MKGAEEIWHLGDVCDPSTLVEFEQVGVPLHVVAGNCDEHTWPLSLTLERGGLCFFLSHIPPAPERVAPGIDAVLHGHTHVPRDETIRGVRWLNPGCITRPNRGAAPGFAWLTVDKGRMRWEPVRLRTD